MCFYLWLNNLFISVVRVSCTTLVQDFDRRASRVYVGTEGTPEISVPSTQFFSEPKTALLEINK